MTDTLAFRFQSPSQAVDAVKALRRSGFDDVEAYGPYPDDDLLQETAPATSRLPLIALIFGFVGAFSAYGLQYWTAAVQYPINIGGRPLHSWPAFIPITFELTVLSAALSIVVGFLVLTGLPSPYHPVFALESFERASDDLFFLRVKRASKSDQDEIRQIAQHYGAEEVFDALS